MIAGVKMTLRGRFFGRDEYMQMVFQALQKIRGTIFNTSLYKLPVPEFSVAGPEPKS